MEMKKRSSEKRGGLKLGGLGGGGGLGLAVVVGGALVAATVWSVSEFRRRRKPSCKKGTMNDFQTPNFEKVKNVDEGGDGGGVGAILRNSKLLADGDESRTEEKDSSTLNLLLDVEKSLKLGIIGEEEEFQEGKKIEDDESVNGNMALFQKEDGIVCNAVSVHETMREGVGFCVHSVDTDTSSSVSEDDLSASEDEVTESRNCGIMVVEKVEVAQSLTPESFVDNGIARQKIGDEVVQIMTSTMAVDDGSNDAVSEDVEYKGEDGNEGSSRRTSDSSSESNAEAVWQVESSEALSQSIEGEGGTKGRSRGTSDSSAKSSAEATCPVESSVALSQSIKGKYGTEGNSRGTSYSSTEFNAEAAWPVESLEAISQAIEDEKNLTDIQNEIVEAEDSEKMSSANLFYHNNNYDDDVRIYKEGQFSTSKIQNQMIGHSANVRIWISTILLALLVLLGALLAQYKYFSPALTEHISSLNAFLMK